MSVLGNFLIKRKQKYVLVIGFVRTGKSALCKTLGQKFNNKEIIYNRSDDVSDTDDCFVYYNMEEQGITIIDIPGKEFFFEIQSVSLSLAKT